LTPTRCTPSSNARRPLQRSEYTAASGRTHHVIRDACELLCLDLPKAGALRAALPRPEALEAVGREEKLVSHHVRQLKHLGIARSRRDGRMVMYELTELGSRLAAAHRAVMQVTG
jgi:DNA-binding transcriptional ArsR family regulator